MNLNSRKARAPIAALGVVALVAGGGWLAASASAAPTALTLNSGGTAPVVANLGYATTAAANAAYALKLTGADELVTLKLASAPTGGHLAFLNVGSNGAATTAFRSSNIATEANEVQTILRSGTPATGAYTLSIGSVTTASITTYTDTAMASALNLVVGDGNDVSVVLTSQTYAVTFGGSLAGTNMPPLSSPTNTLATSVPAAVTLTHATTTQGEGPLAALGRPTSADYIYVTGDVPGVYTFRMFQDRHGDQR